MAMALRTKDKETIIRVNEVIKIRIAGARVRMVNNINICKATAVSPGFSVMLRPRSIKLLGIVIPHLSASNIKIGSRQRFFPDYFNVTRSNR